MRRFWPERVGSSGTVMVAGAVLCRVPDRDATLDAFITPDPDEDEDTADPDDILDEQRTGDVDATDADVAPVDASGADPVTERAETTFAWSPESVACEACGSQTQRRWRTDAGFVCDGCVDWERAPER